ncbi:MAG: lipid-binding SYLF domain-containing protein [Bdellovibrionota bacterium]
MNKKIIFVTAMLAGAMSVPTYVRAEPELPAKGANAPETDASYDSPAPVQHVDDTARSTRKDTSERYMMRRESREDSEKLIRDAAQVFSKFKSGPEKIPESTLSKAQCVAIFPAVTSAALVVGGSHGDGVVSCKGEGGKWSQVGFLDMSSASIGAQLGAKKSDVVLLMMNQKSKDALTKGSEIALGGDLSVAVGNYDAGANINTERSDVVAFASERGLFAGASLNGTRISSDKDSMQAFYRQPSELSTVISRFDVPSDSSDTRQLINALSKSQS